VVHFGQRRTVDRGRVRVVLRARTPSPATRTRPSTTCACARRPATSQTSGRVYYPTTDASCTCASWYVVPPSCLCFLTAPRSRPSTRYGASTCITSWSGGPATDLPGSASDPWPACTAASARLPGSRAQSIRPADVPARTTPCQSRIRRAGRVAPLSPLEQRAAVGGLQYRRAAEQARLSEWPTHCPRGMDACIVPERTGTSASTLRTSSVREGSGRC
jgi:hypothetical protein